MGLQVWTEERSNSIRHYNGKFVLFKLQNFIIADVDVQRPQVGLQNQYKAPIRHFFILGQ